MIRRRRRRMQKVFLTNINGSTKNRHLQSYERWLLPILNEKKNWKSIYYKSVIHLKNIVMDFGPQYHGKAYHRNAMSEHMCK